MKKIIEGLGKKIKESSSPRRMIIAFVGTSILGALLLMLPISLKNGQKISYLTSFFTVVSAICVTGLSLVDISEVFNPLGLTLILIFIQLGGLGLMTFSAIIAMLTGKRMTYSEKLAVKDERNAELGEEINSLLRKMFKTVFIIEGIGAIILTFTFKTELGFSWLRAFYYGIFHSVSAFCNAGFSLFSDGLKGFSGNILFNLSVAYLIIIGGLGFSVIHSYIMVAKKGINKFNLTSKLAIQVSVFLTYGGMLMFFIMERNNPGTIGNMSVIDKVTASFFQSVTTRTAGFNTVPMENLRNGTVFLFYILMFIGASPGSTGGGLKTTTIGVIVFYVIGIIKGDSNVNVFNRRISWDILNKALAILVIALMYVGTVILLISYFDKFSLKEVIFEVISAFATVGLTLGITPELNIISKILIIITMFIGRLGPMTFALAIGQRQKKELYKYPKENIIVG